MKLDLGKSVQVRVRARVQDRVWDRVRARVGDRVWDRVEIKLKGINYGKN